MRRSHPAPAVAMELSSITSERNLRRKRPSQGMEMGLHKALHLVRLLLRTQRISL